MPSLADTKSKRMSGRTARELDRAENAAVRLRAKVRLEGRLGLPLLDQDDGFFRALLLVDVEGCAARLGQDRPLNGPQDFQDVPSPARRREDAQGSDDHARR